MSNAAKLAISDVEAKEAEEAVQPFKDVYLLAIPMPLYTALSNKAAKRGLTVAQLLSRAFEVAIEEI